MFLSCFINNLFHVINIWLLEFLIKFYSKSHLSSLIIEQEAIESSTGLKPIKREIKDKNSSSPTVLDAIGVGQALIKPESKRLEMCSMPHMLLPMLVGLRIVTEFSCI